MIRIRAKAKYNLGREINRFFIVINSVFLLISCQNSQNHGLKTVFRYNSPSGISSLDPAYARTQENIRAVNQLFNGLVELDENLQVVSAIAKSWEISEDGLVYTFKIRSGVFFHKHQAFGPDSTRAVRADDFVFSFNRIIDPVTASDGAWIFNGTVSGQNPFSAMNDSIFVVRLNRPFAPFLGLLSMAYCSVIPQEVVKDNSVSFGKEPIGTGPFQFANWENGVRLNFIKHPDYYESTNTESIPYLDAVSITFIQNKQTELLELAQGKLDVFAGLESSFKDEILSGDGTLRAKYNNDFTLLVSPFLNTEFLAFQMESNSIFSDVEFRRALNYAVNRSAMIKFLRNNIGSPAMGGFIPKGLPGSVKNSPYSYNLKKAKEHLAKSSYSQDGDPLELYTTKDYLDLCVLVQKDFEKLGVKVEINVIPSSLLRQQKSSGELQFFRGSWIADYPDAENYMACFYSKNKAPNGPNYCRFENKEFDQYYEELLNASSETEKLNILEKMEFLLLDQAPFIILFYDESLWIHSNDIKGLRIDPLNKLDLRKVQKR